MDSKERIKRSIERKEVDYIPLYLPVFGFKPSENLRWEKNGIEVKYWYTQRLEHIHTLPYPWEIEDEFKRVKKWFSLGIDDIIDVSVGWSIDESVIIEDKKVIGERYPVLIRKYKTPDGELVHMVYKSAESKKEGWVIQPDYVPLFEDFNLSYPKKHIITAPEDILNQPLLLLILALILLTL